jgi:chemotaxis signal transduction protein
MAAAADNLIKPRSSNLRYGFRIAGLQLVPFERVVTEVVADARVFPVPKSAPSLAGIVNLRGTIVPLLDPDALGTPVTDIRPSQQRALVFDREDMRVGVLIKDDPALVALVEAPANVARPDSPLAAFLLQPWVQEDQPTQIWWEFDHRAAFQFLASPA